MQRSGDDGSRSSAPSNSSGADITTEAAAGASAERSLAARLTSAGGMSDIERLLALQQQQRQQQQQSHLSSSLSGLLAQQRLQQLQQPQGLAGLNTLALLQRQHQEQLLAEQLGFAHGLGGSSLDALNAERLLASRAGLGSHQHQLFGALGQGLPSGLGVELTRSAGIVPGLNSFASITRAEQERSASDEMGKISATGKLKKADNSDDEAEKEDDIDSAEGNDDEEEGRSKDGDEGNDTFPFKLFRMLEEAETEGKDIILSFNASGKCFMIHKSREFISEIMPKYFTTSRMSSFQRQLNLYGFRRISEGPDKGGYVHENFIKGKKSLCKKIKRKKPSIKLPPSGLSYVNPSILGNFATSPSLSVRQMIADGHISEAAGITALQLQQQQLAMSGGLNGLTGLAGLSPSITAALLLEQQHQQQQQQQRQHSSLLHQLIVQQQRERELQFLEQQRRNQDRS